jgi:hypothetical protein
MGQAILVFDPVGGGIAVNLSVSSTTARVALTALGDSRNVRFHNNGNKTAYMRMGDSTVEATTTGCMSFPAGAIEILSVGPAMTHLSAITAGSDTTTINCTSGHGA